MKWRSYALLALIGLIAPIAVTFFQSSPGYMDADYYMAGGLRLVEGHGFTETYLWNYLDNPVSLPHPSHTYWLPLASILAAASMFLSGQHTFSAARLIFILIAALAPPLVACLSYSFFRRRDLALASGLLAAFPGYHAPFLATTDNFAVLFVLGALFFLFAFRNGWLNLFAAGLVVGLMGLARSDGLMWLGLGGLVVLYKAFSQGDRSFPKKLSFFVSHGLVLLAGYLIIMGPWLARNLMLFGSPLTPGGGHVLWLTSYNDTFTYPPSQLTFQRWLAAGWQSALSARAWALKQNLLNAFAAQGNIFLWPFILLGVYALRKDLRLRIVMLGWGILFLVMTLLFPFAGARGSFFHAGATFQPVWWSLAPFGLEIIVQRARRRGWFTPSAFSIFLWGMLALDIAMTFLLIDIRVIHGSWNESASNYHAVENYLAWRVPAQDGVFVANPPGFFLASGRTAIEIPRNGPATLDELSQKFGAHVLILEKDALPDTYTSVYEHPQNQTGLEYLGKVNDALIFLLQPSP